MSTQTFTQEFREEVATKFLSGDKTSAAELAERYGITSQTVRVWSRRYDRDAYNKAKTPRGRKTSQERKKLITMINKILEGDPATRPTTIANQLGISPNTVRYLAANGRVPMSQCCLCGADSTTKYCKQCTDSNYPYYMNTYGLSYDQIINMPTSCEICGSETLLHVDHDHSTGEYRGILCHQCNTGLGLFKDSESALKKAIKYLKTNKN